MKEIKGETDHCRERLLKYCRGQGLDLGCGSCKIKLNSIGIDIANPSADMIQDARILKDYDDNLFDYVYSSHLIEEIADPEKALKEWIRILKPGGYLVLYQADKEFYYDLDDPQCNKNHKHHFSWEELWSIIEKIGDMTLVHHARYNIKDHNEWSFELVTQKNGKKNKTIKAKEPEGISILVPTKDRIKNMEDFSRSVDTTVTDPRNIEIVFGIHEEDQKSLNKAKELDKELKISIRSEFINHYDDGQIHLSFLWNQLYKKAYYSILGFFGDDVLYKTKGWDKEVRKEFEKDRAILFSCNDVHIQKGRLATLFFTHRCVHEKIGFYLNPIFRRWFMDTFWDNAFRRAGKMKYHEDILTEHLHGDKFPERRDDIWKKMDNNFVKEDINRWHQNTTRDEIFHAEKVIKSFDKPKKIISFGLWGDNNQYMVGAIENVKLAKKYYPEWKCRFYVDDKIPSDLIKKLQDMESEIIEKGSSEASIGLFWRFEPAYDPYVERFISRDCDSRLNAREAEAVKEWEDSGLSFHAMRDHREHHIPIMGGMWGAKSFFLPDFKELMKNFIDNQTDKIIKKEKYFYTDQIFLKDIIWPRIKNKALVHDDAARITGEEKSFSVHLEKGLFVGQQWDANNNPLFV